MLSQKEKIRGSKAGCILLRGKDVAEEKQIKEGRVMENIQNKGLWG